jgi:L-histidine Nalpha-methyltransferase
MLNVINRHLETDLLAKDFEHLAFYNAECSRIEMHLRAKKDLDITSHYLDRRVNMTMGETIHTENSHKFARAGIESLAWRSHLKVQNIHTDGRNWFSLVEVVKH